MPEQATSPSTMAPVNQVATAAMEPVPAQASRRSSRAATRVFRSSLALTAGLIMTTIMLVLSLSAPLISPHDPIKQDLVNSLRPPSATYPLGTDDVGRDLLSRTLYGGRIALPLVVAAVAWSSVIGVLVGLLAGYAGGWVDLVLMRVMDAQLAIPGLLLSLGITAALGPSFTTLVIAIGVAGIPSLARVVRSQVLVIREMEYVTGARVIGATGPRIMFLHVIPGVTSNIIVALSLRAPAAIAAEAGLSFLGLGVQPPTPTWGSMISAGQRYIEFAPWFTLVPTMAMASTVLALTLLGEGLRDLLDPRARSLRGNR